MAQIRMLTESMIGKIAAGEVVERPASAIKELVENSLDAGATSILVEIREGGVTLIRVSDNGCGIDGSDIRMAFERHATSKIRKEEDLNAIGTLGFRGEALASIAAVSRVTMQTRTAREDMGLKVRNEGGQIVAMEDAACPVGTTITVKDLFFNVPVRRGFLKKASTETNAVTDLMMRLILSRPDVSFRYVSNDRVLYRSPGDGKVSSALLAIYGSRAVRAMREVNAHQSGVRIHGYVGIGDNARSSRGNESFFVNGRMLRSPLLSGAVEDACRERVMIDKFPICALYLDMPYEAVNINVHPNKMEVRFRDDREVRGAVFTAVYEALQDRDPFQRPVEMNLTSEKEERDRLPTSDAIVHQEAARESEEMAPSVQVSFGGTLPEVANKGPDRVRPAPVFRPVERSTLLPKQEESMAAPKLREDASAWQEEELQPDLLPPPDTERIQTTAQPDTGNPPTTPATIPEEVQTTLLPEEERVQPMRIFGALFKTYILIEYEDHLLMIDQHAAHERLLFDRLMKTYEAPHAGQELLIPLVVSLTRAEQAVLEENRELLEGLGLTVEPFGDQEVAIRSVPVILGTAETETFLREAIEELQNGKIPGADKKRAAILQTACKHAVKGGEALSEDDLRSIVFQMIDQKVTPTCPHGRPLVVSISHTELDRKFKRIQ